MIYAVIPAAGLSRRMGRPKLVLPLGSKTVLRMVIDALRLAGMKHIVVVVAPGMSELVELAIAAGADVCTLPVQTPEMRATVEYGLGWIEARFQPQDRDAWLLVPGDHPSLEANTVRRLLEAREEHGHCSIWLPTYHGRRGHPALIAWKHFRELRSLPAEHGINVYLRQHAAELFELPVATESVVSDLDVPEDYENLLRLPSNV